MAGNADWNKLAAIPERLAAVPEWAAFAEFATLRSRGLRAEAMKSLKGFVDDAAAWEFASRLRFTKWALQESRKYSDPNFFLPQPAQERLVLPTVREWLAAEPTDAEPHLWLGLLRCDDPFAHLERALELDPSCEIARQTLAHWILADVDYNQHELPSFYIHDARHDLRALDKVLRLTDGSSGGWTTEVRLEVVALQARAAEWLKRHPRPGDFAVH